MYDTVGFGISEGLSEVAVIVSVCVSSAAPVLMPDRFTVCSPASSSMAMGLEIAARVGASLTALTVTVNVLLVLVQPVEETLTVLVPVYVPA